MDVYSRDLVIMTSHSDVGKPVINGKSLSMIFLSGFLELTLF